MELTNQNIIGILENWNIGKVNNIEKAQLGLVNHNWIIKTKNKKYVLREVARYKKPLEINFELEYLNFLKNKKFPYKIPSPIKTIDKKLSKTFKKRNYWLYEYIEGKIIEETNLARLKEIAIMISNYHKILEKSHLRGPGGKAKPYHKDAIIKEMDCFNKIISKKKHLTKADVIFRKESVALKNILKNLPTKTYRALKKYPLHRDPNGENLVWKKDKLIGVIDFDNVSSAEDVLVRDLGVIIQRCCHNKKYEVDMKKAKYFLKEYMKRRKLSREELELLPDLITGIFIEDFSYAYWLLLNDKKRGKVIWLKENSYPARWYYKNREILINEFVKLK